MKQVLVRGGKVQVEEVPPPTPGHGQALVRVSHSLISSGTESSFVSDGGKASFVVKKARDPLNVEKVKRKLASVGFRGTYDLVKSKLFEFQAPGYSTAGTIVACGPALSGYRVGDRVACAGMGYACHAEYNVVPQQLLTPIPDGVGFQEAAYVALGAIAMQGVRQAQTTLGETFVVMGLGLVGQLALQILRAAGCRVICSDPIAAKQALAKQLGAEIVCGPGALSQLVNEWTGGYGTDGVLICAASKESGVANAALDLCRSKGRVVVVGAVGMNLVREPMYMKELDFRLSCSYGPGRYSAGYEEKGLDYPIGYVRWTEGRNMGEFLRMLAEGKVRVTPLISVVKPVEQAREAYSAILDKESDTVSALISYGAELEPPARPASHKLVLQARERRSDRVGVAVIGAGGFASAFHLPNLARMPEASLEAVVDVAPQKAKAAAEKHGARFCASDYHEVLADDRIQAVVIATRHNLHPVIAIEAARAGKHVFTEKPLAITVEECEAVRQAVEETGILLSVGFNRRFSKFSREAKSVIDAWAGPKMLLYRCNAGAVPPGHWTLDPVEGGGRIVGEGVHFFDLCCWLVGQDPVDVRADRIDAPGKPDIAEDNLSVILRFPDGSTATVLYCSLGHPGFPKECVEVYGAGAAVCIDDYRGIRFAGVNRKNVKQSAEHKGQYELLHNWVQAIRGEAELSVTVQHGLRATWIAQEALKRCHTPETP